MLNVTKTFVDVKVNFICITTRIQQISNTFKFLCESCYSTSSTQILVIANLLKNFSIIRKFFMKQGRNISLIFLVLIKFSTHRYNYNAKETIHLSSLLQRC